MDCQESVSLARSTRQVPTGWPQDPYRRPYGGTPGAPVMYQPPDPEDESAGYGYSNPERIQEKNVFFYHSDHLGSTSYITDLQGNATQFVCYKPCGEALVDEHNTTYEQPWKFNGKELDSETELYYYGARYYDPTLALWCGVDPMTYRMPDVSPYAYCHANPVRLLDPNGMFDTEADAKAYAERHNVSPENVHYANDRKEWFVAFGADGKGYQSGGTLERRFEAIKTAATELSDFNNIVASASFSFGTKEQIIEYAVSSAAGKSLRELNSLNSSQQAAYELQALGKAGSKYLKATKLVGKACFALTVYSSLSTIEDAYSHERPDRYRRYAKATLDGIVAGVGAFGGPIGWAIGGAYFVVDICGGWNYLLDIKEDE